MSLVNLVSGGLDSTLIGVMSREQGLAVHPLFLDYGQRAAEREWHTCVTVHKALGLSEPVRMDLSGFGKIIASGLTRTEKDIKKEAFTPGRNFLFLLAACSYAYQVESRTVAIGLLSDKFALFPDQRTAFIIKAEKAIQEALGVAIQIITPLSQFTKADVTALALQKGITGTYSCHSGTEIPCGQCISCLETMNHKTK
jgi:7-cyano-7-deazaguanine synthase